MYMYMQSMVTIMYAHHICPCFHVCDHGGRPHKTTSNGGEYTGRTSPFGRSEDPMACLLAFANLAGTTGRTCGA